MEGKVSPPAILAALQRHLTRLHQAQSHMQSGASMEEAMRALRPPVFVMRKSGFAAHLRIWSLPALSSALERSLGSEKKIKTAASPAQSLMGRLLLALSQYAAKRRR